MAIAVLPVNGDSIMKKSPACILTAVLLVLACGLVFAPPVTARDPCADWAVPQLDFTFSVIPAETFPVAVQFNGTYSTRADEPIPGFHWDFGDGTTSTVLSTDRGPGWLSPRHSYTTLRDRFRACFDGTTICGIEGHRCRDVQAYCTAPEAMFAMDVAEGPAPLKVRITDTSAHTPGGTTTWVYTKDGGTISTERDFAGTFTTPGTYTITQTVKKNCNPQGDSFSRQLRVTPGVVQGTVMNISFPTTTPTIGVAGVYFNFSNAPSQTVTTTTAAGVARAGAAPAYIVLTTSAVITTIVPVPYGSAVPSVAPPAPGTLSVITNPAGAQVFIDDVLRGASPATVPNLPAGSHTLRLEREGYRSMTVPVDISDGKTTEYSTALVPDAGGSTVSLPFIVAAVLILVLASAGAYLYTKRKKAP
jgi:hypothetical protein